MLTPPDLSIDTIAECVRENFGLYVVHVTFLPIGADTNSAVYRVTTDGGTSHLLKLRKGLGNEAAVTVPALLHARGIKQVMAPLATTTHRWWVQTQGFAWMLYPFFEGKTGFAKALSPTQWVALGATMRAVHATHLPADVQAQVPREAYAPHNRDIVQTFHQHVAERAYDDPVAAHLAAFWMTKRDEIHTIVERAEQLAQVLQRRTMTPVVCHGDLHGGNVLVGADDTLAIVDWDELILAPKERDLMFVGGGVGGIWNQPEEAAWFGEGYGHTTIDPVALAFYRYERIVADIAAYAEQIFGMHGSADDRAQGLHQLMGQFQPNSDYVVEIAHRTYALLA